MKWIEEFRKKMEEDQGAKKRLWIAIGVIFVVVLLLSFLAGR